MSDHFGVVVIGGGQAGLAVSRELSLAGVEHVVLEKGRVGQSWRGRWDSFCFVTPNWSMQLPGMAYDGPNPDGFDPRDAIVGFLERYADGIQAPVREGVDVTSLRADGAGRFVLETSIGPITAEAIVVGTGGFQRPHRPEAAAALPPGLLRTDVSGYRNPGSLPPGGVLVVGSGQSGCQIAEELHESGRPVFLSCGRAPWAPRRIGDHDVVWWTLKSGFADAPVSSLPDPRAKLAANVLATGRNGGHDLNLRTLRRMGVTLVGHLAGVEGDHARFADDLPASVAWGDEKYLQLGALFRTFAQQHGLPEPDMPAPEPFAGGAPTELPLNGLAAVIFAGGFRPNYASWIDCPDAFDEMGFPVQVDGVSTVVPGLFFIGVHFQRKRKSSTMIGVGEDAAIVARAIAGRLS